MKPMNSNETLKLLGQGESIETVCKKAGWSREAFESWWRDEARRRVPAVSGSVNLPGLKSKIRIERDTWGIPRIAAGDAADLFFGFGFTAAQDRLFQLDYLRRKARGRLAEILGPDGLESDRLYRTLGLAQVAEVEWDHLSADTRAALTSYSAGINACMAGCGERLPIEFDLLDYRPEPWAPTDSLAIAGEFRWYLTGRFPVIVVPELVKRTLGDGPLYRAFLQGEANDESIMPPGSYKPAPPRPGRAGSTISDRDQGAGSNNWVLTGSRTVSGKPLLASDPHVLFGASSIWHEVDLRGGPYRTVGIAYVGVPGIMIGRNERVAWGLTNNICSLRDLYQEKIDKDHPDCFLFDGGWEPAKVRDETIVVSGSTSLLLKVRSSRNGPIVDDVLPAAARGTGPVSLRWLGFEPCGWVTAMLGTMQARNVAEFCEATRPWSVPTFNMVVADVDGHIGHQCTGRIPIRKQVERGYRNGWDPDHAWAGVIPFEEMPRQIDPPRGFAVSANNRLAPDDFPYPLSGTYSSGHRAHRIRTSLEAKDRWSEQSCILLQYDITSERARECVPHLLALLASDHRSQIHRAVSVLKGWDYRVTSDSAPALLFNVFFSHWCKAVAAERLPAEIAEFASASAGGLAAALLAGDAAGWFTKRPREEAIKNSMIAAVDELTKRFGPLDWRWDKVHTLLQKHVLTGRGDLGRLLDQAAPGLAGDTTTVCNMTPDASYAVYLGPSYRMVCDLADPRKGIWSVGVPGQSGHPGSTHFGDQLEPWLHGNYHHLALDNAPLASSTGVLTLEPG